MKRKIIVIAANVLLACIVVISSVLLTLKWIESYTLHGEYIDVPDFQYMSVEEAKAVAEHSKLRIVVTDSMYNNTFDPSTVIEQYPKANSKVKENRLIQLHVNLSKARTTPFPDLKNAAFRQTINTLMMHGFTVGRIDYISSNYKNLVIDLSQNGESITKGDVLNYGSVIDITLGSGSGDNLTVVPNLYNNNVKQAYNNAHNAYLNIVNVIKDDTFREGDDINKGYVYKQEPYKGSRVKGGANIMIYISRDKDKKN